MEHAVSEVVPSQTVSYLAGYRAETQQMKTLADGKILIDSPSFHSDSDEVFVFRVTKRLDSNWPHLNLWDKITMKRRS